LRAAVGAIAGGLLINHHRDPPTCSEQASKRDAFTGRAIGFRQWDAVKEALRADPPLIGICDPITFNLFGAWKGEASRYWPLPGLLDMADKHGVGGGLEDWGHVYPATPPRIVAPLVLKALKADGEKASIPIPLGDYKAEALRMDVEAFNARAAQHTFTGCLPPRWGRTFHCLDGMPPGWNLGGRWWAGGADSYQRMPESERGRITIDGHAVVEVDAVASHLSIFLALAGEDCLGDPYDIPGIPREVAKAFITCTFGSGKPIAQWPKDQPREVRSFPLGEARKAILHRHPALVQPWVVVPGNLDRGTSQGLLTHTLMGFEAAAITAAMKNILSDTGFVPLSTHDGFLVPVQFGGAAKKAIRGAYRDFVGVPHVGVSSAGA
jgi:hypothetical protein